MKRKRIRAKYLRLNERTNALDSLEQVYNFLQQAEHDLQRWKWVIIALDAALYGFAICACAGTDWRNVTTKKGHLINLNDALARCQDTKWMRRLSFGKPLVSSPSQRKSIDYVHKIFRNKFIHFSPKGWSIELHGIPSIVMDVLDVIRFLAIDTKYVSLNSTQSRIVKSLVYQTRLILKRSKLHQEFLHLLSQKKT